MSHRAKLDLALSGCVIIFSFITVWVMVQHGQAKKKITSFLPAVTTGRAEAGGFGAWDGKGKIAFLFTSDDIEAAKLSLNHALLAKESDFLEDVVWLSYGHAVSHLTNLKDIEKKDLTRLLGKAHRAGVKICICGSSLKQEGIQKSDLILYDEVVPNGILLISEWVSKDYQLLKY